MASHDSTPQTGTSAALGWFVAALNCHQMREGMGDTVLPCNLEQWGEPDIEERERPRSTHRRFIDRSHPRGGWLIAQYSKGGSV